ncbi:MAG: phosphate acyltransferase PlsX [Thomasclavelia sp.]|nr:phosphate acyltransferase PlsX [Thomasclavelia sp.]
MKLGIDAMSGDLGSKEVVEACKVFAENNKNDELFVVGKQEQLQELTKYNNIKIIDSREVLEMTEDILAIRRKKEASMVKTLMLARNDEVDAVVSCGNTGAYYASATLFIKRLKGVERSCLMAVLPTYSDKGVCMLDVGANAENTPEQLEVFALLGSVYANAVRNIQKPRVKLLNIGTEDHKGDSVHKETYQLLLKNKHVNFEGNIEGKGILNDEADVIVTDGFTGNVALKSIEGTATTLVHCLKDGFLSSLRNKMGAMMVKPVLKTLVKKFDPNTVGGALMLGFNKPIVKAHGASDSKAIINAMMLAKSMVERDVIEKMKEGLE